MKDDQSPRSWLQALRHDGRDGTGRSRQARCCGQGREGDRLRGDCELRHRFDAGDRHRRQGGACGRSAQAGRPRALARGLKWDRCSNTASAPGGSIRTAVLASTKDAEIILDTDINGRPDAFNPGRTVPRRHRRLHDQGHRAGDADAQVRSSRRRDESPWRPPRQPAQDDLGRLRTHRRYGRNRPAP